MLDHAAVMLNNMSKDARVYPMQRSIGIDMDFRPNLPLDLDSESYHEDSRKTFCDD
jgi:hypothetical protein